MINLCYSSTNTIALARVLYYNTYNTLKYNGGLRYIIDTQIPFRCAAHLHLVLTSGALLLLYDQNRFAFVRLNSFVSVRPSSTTKKSVGLISLELQVILQQMISALFLEQVAGFDLI